MKISKLKNLGPKTEGWLAVIGISSSDQLKATPVDKIYYQLKDKGFPVNMTLIYAIEGALTGEYWLALSENRKAELKTLIQNSEYIRPEDVGGTDGFDRFKERMADPSHEEHDDFKRWYGGAFDPNKFNPEDVKFWKASISLRTLFR